MAERYACHVFAHSEGRYQTVHAVGVAPDEVRQLEQFFFGQSADPRYLESLRDEPGVIWRRIGSRISLTRVSQGKRDANGRSTLRFDTLLADSTNAALRSQVAELCTGKWRASADGVAVTAQQPTPSRPVNAGRISEVVLAARDGSHVVVRADEFTLGDASRIIQYAADIPGFSLCYKSLNKQAPVSVNIVAMAVSETIKMKSKRNPAPMSRLPSRPPAQRAGPQSGTTLMLVVILVAFILQTAIFWMMVGAPSGESEVSKMQGHILNKIEAEFGKQTERIDAVASESQKRDRDLFEKIVGRLDGLVQDIRDMSSAVNTNLRDFKTNRDAIGSLRDDIKGLRQKISDNESKAKQAREDIEGSLKELEKEVKLMRDGFDELGRKIERNSASRATGKDSSDNAKEHSQ